MGSTSIRSDRSLHGSRPGLAAESANVPEGCAGPSPRDLGFPQEADEPNQPNFPRQNHWPNRRRGNVEQQKSKPQINNPPAKPNNVMEVHRAVCFGKERHRELILSSRMPSAWGPVTAEKQQGIPFEENACQLALQPNMFRIMVYNSNKGAFVSRQHPHNWAKAETSTSRLAKPQANLR